MIITAAPLVTLDIETAIGFDDVKQINPSLGLQNAIFARNPWIAVTNCEGVITRWTSEQSSELLRMLAGAGTVTGWNIEAFDYPVIALTNMMSGSHHWKLPVNLVDPFFEIAREAKKRFQTEVFYSLQAVSQLNFQHGKLGDSALIPALFSANLESVYAHCECDVELEQRVYGCALAGQLRLPAKGATKYSPEIPEWTFKLEVVPF